MLCCISHSKGSKTIDTLSYGDGKIRVYPSDQVDARLYGVATANTRDEIINHLRESEDPVLVPVHLAKKIFGWKDGEFDSLN